MINVDHFPHAVRAIVEKIDLSRFAIPIKLSCHEQSDRDVGIRLSMSVNDVAHGFPTTVHSEITIDCIRGLGLTLAGLAVHVIERVEHVAKRLVCHEIDECLFYGGEQFRDPHAAEKDDEAKRAEMRRMSGAR